MYSSSKYYVYKAGPTPPPPPPPRHPGGKYYVCGGRTAHPGIRSQKFYFQEPQGIRNQTYLTSESPPPNLTEFTKFLQVIGIVIHCTHGDRLTTESVTCHKNVSVDFRHPAGWVAIIVRTKCKTAELQIHTSACMTLPCENYFQIL